MKILILDENRHNSIGGIESYTRKLINIFAKHNHEVYEYSLNFNPERIDLFEHEKNVIPLNKIEKTNKKIGIFKRSKLIKKTIKEIEKIESNYDVVINQISNVKWSKKTFKKNNWIYVQHFNPDFYKQKFIAGRFLAPIIYFGMNLVGIKNPFEKFKNFVCFSVDDEKELFAKRKDKEYYSTWINVSSYSKNEIESFKKNFDVSKNKQLFFFGRIDNYQKNIKNLVKFVQKNNMNIDIYGHGNAKLVNNKKNVEYLGTIKNNELEKTIRDYKFNIVFSKFEGFNNSIVECLSMGIPTLSTNNCPSSKTLTYKKGHVIDMNTNLKEIINISEDEYQKMANNCFDFALENLTLETFEQKWIDLVNKIGRVK